MCVTIDGVSQDNAEHPEPWLASGAVVTAPRGPNDEGGGAAQMGFVSASTLPLRRSIHR